MDQQPPDASQGGAGSSPRGLSNLPQFIFSDQAHQRTDESRRKVRAQAARVSAANRKQTLLMTRGGKYNKRRAAQNGEGDDASDLPLISGSPPAATGAEPDTQEGAAGPSMPHSTSSTDVQQQEAHIPASLLEQTVSTAPLLPALGNNWRSPGLEVPIERGLSGIAMSTDVERILDTTRLRRLPPALPRGFVAIQERNGAFLYPNMTSICIALACFDPAFPGAAEMLARISTDLAKWEPNDSMVNLCKFRFGDRDGEVNCQGYAHISQGLLCISSVLSVMSHASLLSALPIFERFDDKVISAKMKLLNTAILVNTVFEQAALWSLFMVCAVTRQLDDISRRALPLVIKSMNLRTWQEVRSVLLSFIYPASVLDGECQNLWNTLEPLMDAGPAA